MNRNREHLILASVVPRNKINLEKIKASLTMLCPLCGASLGPEDWQRVDGERVKCAKCHKTFVPVNSARRGD